MYRVFTKSYWVQTTRRQNSLRPSTQSDSRLLAHLKLPEPDQRRGARRLILIVAAGVIFAIVWASITQVDKITSGQGHITSTVPAHRIVHDSGGVVKTVHVKEGDAVQAHSPIISFDTVELTRELKALEKRRQSLSIELKRLNSILRQDMIQEDPGGLDQSDAAAVFWVDQQQLLAQINVLTASLSTARAEKQSLEDRLVSVRKEINLVLKTQKRTRRNVSRGLATLAEFEGVERNLLLAQRDLMDLENEVSVRNVRMKEIEARIHEVSATRLRDAALRRGEIEAQLVATETDIENIRDAVDGAHISAGSEGRIMNMQVANSGEVVVPGDVLAEVVPAQFELIVAIEIPASDIGAISPGMPAKIKVLAYDAARFGSIEGRVSQVSPTSFANEAQDVVYSVEIQLLNPPGYQDNTILAGRPLRLGMSVVADVQTDRTSVLSYLLKPLRSLQDRAFSEL